MVDYVPAGLLSPLVASRGAITDVTEFPAQAPGETNLGKNSGADLKAYMLPQVNTPLVNEWPDPQICVQDGGAAYTAMNDTLTGVISQISVTSYSTGSSTIVCNTANTAGLLVGSMIYFNTPADPALQNIGFRVVSFIVNTSFTITAEYTSGIPATSFADLVNIFQRADVTGGGGGIVTSQISRFANGALWPSFWISDRPAHIALIPGSKRVLVVQKVISGPELIYWQCPAEQVACLAGIGRAVGMGAYVASGVGATAQCYIYDGTSTPGGVIANSPAFTWISTQKIVNANATSVQLGVVLTGPVGSTFVLGNFMQGPAPVAYPPGVYYTPRAQMVKLLSSQNPWNNLTFTLPNSADPQGYFSFVMDLKQVTVSIFTEGVSCLMGLLEGQAQTAGGLLSSRNNQAAPTLYNPTLTQWVTGADADPKWYGRASGEWYLSAAKMIAFGTQNLQWKHVSFDIGAVIVFAGP